MLRSTLTRRAVLDMFKADPSAKAAAHPKHMGGPGISPNSSDGFKFVCLPLSAAAFTWGAVMHYDDLRNHGDKPHNWFLFWRTRPASEPVRPLSAPHAAVQHTMIWLQLAPLKFFALLGRTFNLGLSKKFEALKEEDKLAEHHDDGSHH